MAEDLTEMERHDYIPPVGTIAGRCAELGCGRPLEDPVHLHVPDNTFVSEPAEGSAPPGPTQPNIRELERSLDECLAGLMTQAHAVKDLIASRYRDLIWTLLRERDEALDTAAVALREMHQARAELVGALERGEANALAYIEASNPGIDMDEVRRTRVAVKATLVPDPYWQTRYTDTQ